MKQPDSGEVCPLRSMILHAGVGGIGGFRGVTNRSSVLVTHHIGYRVQMPRLTFPSSLCWDGKGSCYSNLSLEKSGKNDPSDSTGYMGGMYFRA